MADSEPVRLWRDKFKLNLSKSWKIDVDKTVTDLVLWRKILNGWKYQTSHGTWKSRAPGIKQLLTEYERLSIDRAEKQRSIPSLSNIQTGGINVERDYFNAGQDRYRGR